MRVRRPIFTISRELPNHWMNGNALDTHLANVFHMTIPAGERFLIRVMSRVRTRVRPGLQEGMRAFMGQEGQHAAAHESFSRMLQAKGYDSEKLFRGHEFVFRWIEKFIPVSVCIAMGAGIEHYTAVMGDAALSHQERLEGVDSEMVKLLLWHAAEEVEHKAVVFDVLQNLNPSYYLRLLGFGLATSVLGLSIIISLVSLIRQDHDLSISRLFRDYRKGLGRLPMSRSLLRLTIDYLRPGFHPSKKGDLSAAQVFLASFSSEVA